MSGQNSKRNVTTGSLDGGTGRGVPVGGRDERPRSGYDAMDDDQDLEIVDSDAESFLEEDGDPADRRRDPLRKPGT